jgi:hypothetical protein
MHKHTLQEKHRVRWQTYNCVNFQAFNLPACLTGMSTSDSITTCKREGAKPIILWIWNITHYNITHNKHLFITLQIMSGKQINVAVKDRQVAMPRSGRDNTDTKHNIAVQKPGHFSCLICGLFMDSHLQPWTLLLMYQIWFSLFHSYFNLSSLHKVCVHHGHTYAFKCSWNVEETKLDVVYFMTWYADFNKMFFCFKVIQFHTYT